jgi:hypothetical protein
VGAFLSLKFGLMGEAFALGATPQTGGGGTSLQIPVVTSDPVGAPPGSLWYRSDLGELRQQDGIRNKPQGLVLKRPYTVVGGSDDGDADFGSFTSGTITNGWWEAYQAAPTANGRKYGTWHLKDGTYDLGNLSAGNFPIDLGDLLIFGNGPNTIVQGQTGGSTFAVPSGKGKIINVTYIGN